MWQAYSSKVIQIQIQKTRRRKKCVPDYWLLWCLWWSSCVPTKSCRGFTTRNTTVSPRPPETPWYHRDHQKHQGYHRDHQEHHDHTEVSTVSPKPQWSSTRRRRRPKSDDSTKTTRLAHQNYHHYIGQTLIMLHHHTVILKKQQFSDIMLFPGLPSLWLRGEETIRVFSVQAPWGLL